MLVTIIIFKLFNFLKYKKPQKKVEYITKSNPKFQKIMKKLNTLKDKASKILNSSQINNQKLEEALNKYSEAIDLKIKDKINAILYSNRAWVNLKLERNGAALEDANKAIKWNPNYIKAYYRRGCANLTLCKYEEALIDLENVEKEFPEDNILIEKIKEIKYQWKKKIKI